MTDKKSKSPMKAKAFYAHHSLGEHLLDGWEALPLGNDQYKVTRLDKSEIILTIGDVMPKAGPVSLDNNNNIQVGKYTVAVGVNLLKGWEAKKVRGKDNYLIRKDDGSHIQLKLGETLPSVGVLEMDEFDNLKAGNSSIRIAPKAYELNLLVLGEQEEKGFVSYFNYLEPGNSKNRADGTRGVFYPSRADHQPSKFCEYGDDGNLYDTAVFWASKDKTFARGRIRSLTQAMEEKSLYQQKAQLEAEAKAAGLDPMDIHGYEETVQALEHQNKNSWTDRRFTVSHGQYLFRLKSPRRQAENTPAP